MAITKTLTQVFWMALTLKTCSGGLTITRSTLLNQDGHTKLYFYWQVNNDTNIIVLTGQGLSLGLKQLAKQGN